MPIHRKPIQERIDWLFDLADRHGAAFRSPETCLARQRYLAEHPTAIAVLKCMDGRVNIPVVTNTPIGILMPFRNLGGKFDLGWPHLGEVLAHHVQRMVSSGRRVLFLITYHFSKGDPHRGCAGFKYDTAAAMAHTYEIRRTPQAQPTWLVKDLLSRQLPPQIYFQLLQSRTCEKLKKLIFFLLKS